MSRCFEAGQIGRRRFSAMVGRSWRVSHGLSKRLVSRVLAGPLAAA